MKRVAFALSIIFIVLTFVGAGYVLYKHGSVNAGYAVLPLILALMSVLFYLRRE